MSRCCRKTTGASMIRCHEGAQTRVPWHFGILEGGCLEMRSLSQRGPARPARASASGVARQNEKPGRLKNQSDSSTFHDKSTTHLLPSITVPSCHRKVRQLFVLRPIKRALRRPGRCRGNNANKALQCRCLVAVTPESHAVTPIPAPCTHSSSL